VIDGPCESCKRGAAIISRIPHETNAPERKMIMVWTTPTIIEICIGLEINGYLPAEF